MLTTLYDKITTNGQWVEIQNNGHPTEHHCGVCGDDNGDQREDIMTAQNSPAPNPEAAARTYRSNQFCSADPFTLQSSATSSRIAEQCNMRRHAMQQIGSKLCISQVPVQKCGGGCTPQSLVEKRVDFVCIPTRNRRVQEFYERLVREGIRMPELESMRISFSTQLNVPVACKPDNL